MKIVIILDPALPRGVMANTSAALAMSCSLKMPDIIGEDVMDADKSLHAGILNKPVAVLAADKSILKEIRERALYSGLDVISFTDTARKSATYGEYTEKMSNTPSVDLTYLGLCVFGDAEKVSGLTGDLPLVR